MTIAIAVVTLAVLAAFANVALLGSTGEDRLGHLRPVDATLSSPRTSRALVTPPAGTADDTSVHRAPAPAGNAVTRDDRDSDD